MEAIIKSVLKGSIADEIEIEPGDVLLSVNGQRLIDILDFRYLCSSNEYTLEIQKKNGDIEVAEVVNDDYEEFGVEFENGLLDRPKACRNKCLFCFVDQLPKSMRKTLYFKDDDYRLSALMGNYITLTNLNEDDIKRIIDMRLPRINVSVHTVDDELRSKMLGIKESNILSIMERFANAGISMDCQVVLCKGINDGIFLDNTIKSLSEMYPHVQSLSVVPVGLTKHREGLYSLQAFDEKSAFELIKQVEGHQQKLLKDIQTRFVFASDEFYVKANHPLPSFESYEDFLQIENGVGLISSFEEEFNSAIKENKAEIKCTDFTVVTGESAYKYIKELTNKISDKINVVPIKNTFFGESITVAGLLTGQDIIKQLKGKNLGSKVLIPNVMLNSDGLFLDDLTPYDIEKALNTKVVMVEVDGYDFYDKIMADLITKG